MRYAENQEYEGIVDLLSWQYVTLPCTMSVKLHTLHFNDQSSAFSRSKRLVLVTSGLETGCCSPGGAATCRQWEAV